MGSGLGGKDIGRLCQEKFDSYENYLREGVFVLNILSISVHVCDNFIDGYYNAIYNHLVGACTILIKKAGVTQQVSKCIL